MTTNNYTDDGEDTSLKYKEPGKMPGNCNWKRKTGQPFLHRAGQSGIIVSPEIVAVSVHRSERPYAIFFISAA